ncbi:aldehyde dehydrogenase family protein [Nocardia sp. NPDC059228]|uniref:aldehyde dehydrogenase family protein n=1 Tax=Nocardia sp. NPDC059228 TaxID=3346777 RepID=UPI003674B686
MASTEIGRFTVRRPSPDQIPVADVPPAGHFIGGSFVQGSSTEVIDVLDPTTEEILGSVPAGTIDDVDSAVEAALAAHDQPQRVSPGYEVGSRCVAGRPDNARTSIM